MTPLKPTPGEERRDERIAQALDFGLAQVKSTAEANHPESYLLAYHYVKDGRIHTVLNYQDFKHGDWGKVLIATAVEARMAEMSGNTAKAVV